MENIIFVFSINFDELKHTISNYYGMNFDACRYLERFFDYRFDLPKANMEVLYSDIGLNNGTWVYENVCRRVVQILNMSIRETANYYNRAKIAAYKPMHNKELYCPLGNEKSEIFYLCCLIPVMIGLDLVRHDEYVEFLNGENDKKLNEIFKTDEYAIEIISYLLEDNESYSKSNDKKNVKIEEKLRALYNGIFVNEYKDIESIRIGNIVIDKNTKAYLERICAGMSPYADYTL